LVVALDVNITPELANEGVARELVNRVQNIRKNSGFEVTDKIEISVEQKPFLEGAIEQFREYICTETLATELQMSNSISEVTETLEIDGEQVKIYIKRN
jgi:isoleucyl-tRNA synthetase